MKMKDLEIYFTPIEKPDGFAENAIGNSIDVHTEASFPVMETGGLAIMYIPEYRNGEVQYQGKTDDTFRNYFYQSFASIGWKATIYDLGQLLPGETIDDTYFAISNVCAELVKNEIIPIIIGGSQDLTYGMYKGYEQLEQLVNICAVDSKLDIGRPEDNFTAKSYMSHLLIQRPCYLFNFSNIGCQGLFASKEEFELFEKLYFDVCRLGEFNADFKRAEPHLRNTDILSIDLESIRAAEFPSKAHHSPNGFYADQICQIARYAGISDKLTSFGLFNAHPTDDSATANHLLAQIIWYFIDGVSQRKGDFPVGSKKDYIRFSVHLDNFTEEELVFLKSNKSERWWMEVPYPPQDGRKYNRHHLVPCDHRDYELAMKNEIPDLWWKTYQKLG
jgi:formiminoglutamase|tara:strand:- start:1009 stop:2175 length:1167 start_codon:yes stop_codon:yes gene_type:complete